MINNEVEAIAEIRARAFAGYPTQYSLSVSHHQMLKDIRTLLDAYDAADKDAKNMHEQFRTLEVDWLELSEEADRLRARLAEVEAENLRLRYRDDDFQELRGARDYALSLVAERDDAIAGLRANADASRAETFTVRTATLNNAIEKVKERLAAYSVEVFPEPPPPSVQCPRDLVSAGMARHLLTSLIAELEALRDEQPKGGE